MYVLYGQITSDRRFLNNVQSSMTNEPEYNDEEDQLEEEQEEVNRTTYMYKMRSSMNGYS
jgi:hypothetical protein